MRADVRACYDSLSQEWLLAHIPMDRKVLREFLKAGVAFGGELFPTEVGISQGGLALSYSGEHGAGWAPGVSL